MNFIRQLDAPTLPNLPIQSGDDNDVRQVGLQPLAVKPPSIQWFAMPAPDGSGDFSPFPLTKAPTPVDTNRRFGPNDENSAS